MVESERVLVTGGSGYIASFCIAQLLCGSTQVRTTVRSLTREAEVRAAIGKVVKADHRLEVVVTDLNADAGWREACSGCSGVLHVASPIPSRNPRDDDELVRPARDGALRVLKAAREAGVRRVVMTSSTAAVTYGHGGRSQPFTEADWSDPGDRTDSSAYERSKMIAERAAWDWHSREGGALELVTICPGAVLGPVLGGDFSASLDIVKRLIDGSLPGLPHFGWPLADVRDIADLHVRALRAPNAAGQRFIGAGAFYWMEDIARVLRDRVPEVAAKVPKRRLPIWLVRLSSVFDPVVRDRLFELDKERPVSAEKARRELGWAPRSNDEAIAGTAQSLLAEGVVKRGHGRGVSNGGTMRVFLVLLALCAPAALTAASAQDLASPVGRWRTVDDKTGKPSGIVRIYEQNGALYGNIEKVFDPARAGLNCIGCTDDRKDKPLIGLNIIRGLKRDGDVWDGGTLIDPDTGSVYKSSARLDDGGRKLVMRGYIGISLLGRSQTWQREP